jgi:hypothetical protein
VNRRDPSGEEAVGSEEFQPEPGPEEVCPAAEEADRQPSGQHEQADERGIKKKQEKNNGETADFLPPLKLVKIDRGLHRFYRNRTGRRAQAGGRRIGRVPFIEERSFSLRPFLGLSARVRADSVPWIRPLKSICPCGASARIALFSRIGASRILPRNIPTSLIIRSLPEGRIGGCLD